MPRRRRHYRLHRPRIRHYFGRKDKRISLLKTGFIIGQELDAIHKNGGMEALTRDPEAFMKGMVDQNLQKFAGISIFPEMSGISGWHPEIMIPTYTGLIAAHLGSMLATRLGVNRELRKIPMVGRYIKL